MANDTHTDSLRVGGYEIVSPPDAWQKLRETYEFIRNRVALLRVVLPSKLIERVSRVASTEGQTPEQWMLTAIEERPLSGTPLHASKGKDETDRQPVILQIHLTDAVTAVQANPLSPEAVTHPGREGAAACPGDLHVRALPLPGRPSD